MKSIPHRVSDIFHIPHQPSIQSLLSLLQHRRENPAPLIFCLLRHSLVLLKFHSLAILRNFNNDAKSCGHARKKICIISIEKGFIVVTSAPMPRFIISLHEKLVKLSLLSFGYCGFSESSALPGQLQIVLLCGKTFR